MSAQAGYKTIVPGNTGSLNLGTGSVRSWSHTVLNKADRILIVSVVSRNNSVSSITANGRGLTLGDYIYSGGYFAGIYYLLNPDAGANTIEVTMANTAQWFGASIDIYNAARQSPVAASNKVQSTGGSTSLNVTNPLQGCFSIDCQYNSGVTSGTKGANQTLLKAQSSNDSGGIAYRNDCPSGTITNSWTGFETGSTGYSHCAVLFKPARWGGGAAIFNNLINR